MAKNMNLGKTGNEINLNLTGTFNYTTIPATTLTETAQYRLWTTEFDNTTSTGSNVIKNGEPVLSDAIIINQTSSTSRTMTINADNVEGINTLTVSTIEASAGITADQVAATKVTATDIAATEVTATGTSSFTWITVGSSIPNIMQAAGNLIGLKAQAWAWSELPILRTNTIRPVNDTQGIIQIIAKSPTITINAIAGSITTNSIIAESATANTVIATTITANNIINAPAINLQTTTGTGTSVVTNTTITLNALNGTITASNLTVTNTINVTNIAAAGTINTNSLSVTSTISTKDIAAAGAINANSLSATTTVTANTVTANDITATNNVQANNITVTNTVTANNITVTNTVTANNITVTNTITANNITVAKTVQATTFNGSMVGSLTIGSQKYNGSKNITVTASDLGLSNAMHFIGVVSSLPVTATNNGDVVLVNGTGKEYVWSGKWVELGDDTLLGTVNTQLTSVSVSVTNLATEVNTLKSYLGVTSTTTTLSTVSALSIPVATNEKVGGVKSGESCTINSSTGLITVHTITNTAGTLTYGADDINNHIVNNNNPHQVTAEQIKALPLAGGTMTGAITSTVTTNPAFDYQISDGKGLQIKQHTVTNGADSTSCPALYDSKYNMAWFYSDWSVTATDTNNAALLTDMKLYGAVWNDYAEFRVCDEIEPGRCVVENGDDTMSLSTGRLQYGGIISDTFGFVIGERKDAQPIAVSGRVLAFTDEDRNTFKPGDAVCSGANGTISKMTREEIREYPEKILGIVSSIPQYETWGPARVPVNNRIWIKVR